ncbi:MAG: hypothetical protein GY801_26765 [bacterium]|nr:hypothetical protein [bacterium]
MQNVSHHQSMLWSSHEEGREQGRREEKIETVKKSLHKGLELSIIAEPTGLSLTEIQDIQKQQTKV